MQKIFVLLCFCFSIQSIAQNVGIGTAAPTGKLQINHRSSTAVGLKLVDSSGSSAGSVEFRNVNNTKRMLMVGYTESDFNNGQYIDVSSDSSFVATFRGNGMVGIRTGGPQYPLDVNGDINTNGAVRINGNAGSNGQVLRSNGDGSMSWGDMCSFKNRAIFISGTGVWTVPDTVSRIMVEVTGAGAGGNIHGGGGGGAYIMGTLDVTPSTNVTYSVGTGGGGGAGVDGVAGGQSQILYGTISLTATGGSATTFNNTTKNFSSGGGQFVASPATFRNYTGTNGAAGLPNRITFEQKSATSFFEISSGGNGGGPGFCRDCKAEGAYFAYDISGAAVFRNSFPESLTRVVAGTGGGGGYLLSSFGGFGGGGGGANGVVIIHY